MGKKAAEGMKEYTVANILDLLETVGERRVAIIEDKVSDDAVSLRTMAV